MFRRHRPHLPLPLRVFVLAVFALGLVMQPVVAALGELHELAHDPSGNHAVAHMDHADSLGDELSAAEESDPSPAGTTHSLMHHAHCCGQSVVAELPAMRGVPVALGSARPALTEPQRPLQTPSLAPFRPPIPA